MDYFDDLINLLEEEQQYDKTLALLVGSWENELDSFTDVNGNP